MTEKNVDSNGARFIISAMTEIAGFMSFLSHYLTHYLYLTGNTFEKSMENEDTISLEIFLLLILTSVVINPEYSC